MNSEMVFRDLFPFGRKSLVWLRLFRGGEGRRVAVVVDPTDNPGKSAINGAEALYRAISKAFPDFSKTLLFVRYPGDPVEMKWIEVRLVDGEVEFERREVAEVEALVGEQLSDPLDWTCAALAGEDHPLLQMIPPPEPETDGLADLVVIAVSDLPWAHNPGQCAWHRRFEALREMYPSDPQANSAIGAHWFLTLGELEFDGCRYHGADWGRIAGVGVEVFEDLTSESTMEDALEAVRQALPDPTEALWCVSLFTDPISLTAGRGMVSNGQHRCCALRASGAGICVAEVEGGHSAPPLVSDLRRRAAAEIAGFWAKHAAY